MHRPKGSTLKGKAFVHTLWKGGVWDVFERPSGGLMVLARLWDAFNLRLEGPWDMGRAEKSIDESTQDEQKRAKIDSKSS